MFLNIYVNIFKTILKNILYNILRKYFKIIFGNIFKISLDVFWKYFQGIITNTFARSSTDIFFWDYFKNILCKYFKQYSKHKILSTNYIKVSLQYYKLLIYQVQYLSSVDISLVIKIIEILCNSYYCCYSCSNNLLLVTSKLRGNQ